MMDKEVTKKGATLSLVAIMSIIMSVIIGYAVFSGISNYYGDQKTDHSNRLDTFNEIISEVHYNNNLQKDKYTIYVEPYEMYMFFSTGNEPIRLSATFDGKTKNILLERPSYADECNSSACICYCKQGPYWDQTTDEDENIIRRPLSGLTFTQSSMSRGYLCHSMTCQSVNPEDTVFFNSRGYDKEYADALTTSYLRLHDPDLSEEEQSWDTLGEKMKTSTGMPFDVIILSSRFGKKVISSAFNTGVLESLGNELEGFWYAMVLLFSSGDVKEEAANKVYLNELEKNIGPDDIIEVLATNFNWDGGIAIGGTGMPKTKKDLKEGNLRGVVIPLTFQKSNEIENGIAICPADNCLFEKAQQHFAEKAKQYKASETIDRRIHDYNQFIDRSFLNCMKDYPSEKCISEFQIETIDFIQDLHEHSILYDSDKFAIEIYFTKIEEPDSEQLTNMTVKRTIGSQTEPLIEKILPIPFPYIHPISDSPGGVSTIANSPLIITDVNEETLYFTLEGHADNAFDMELKELEDSEYTITFTEIPNKHSIAIQTMP
ncbi:MAG: hypothetical protein ACQESE_01175 [Nanobdellota archaeon]